MLENQPESEIDKKWVAVAKRRLAGLRSETIKPVSGQEVFDKIWKRSVEFPKAWTVLEGEIRRSLVRRFPYGILYSEEREGIFIVAVMNLHRNPVY